MSDAILMVVASEARHAAEALGPDATIEARFNAAAKAARNHWMAPPEDTEFRGAVAGVMMTYPKESVEFRRIEKEVKSLRRVSVMISAARAGLTVSLLEADEEDDGLEPVKLMELWRGSK